MPLHARLLAVAERLREEAEGIQTGRGHVCPTCRSSSFSAGETARFKLSRNLAEAAEKLERLAVDASKVGAP
jgi:hypothetical protein